MQPYNELRFYTFTNFYISPIQHGIQTGHASVDLVRKYEFEFNDAVNSDNDYMKSIRIQNAADNRQVVNDWADAHKTYVVLNGGDDTGITKALELVSKTGFPFVDFREPGLEYKADLYTLLAARMAGVPVMTSAHGWTSENAKVRLYERLQAYLWRWFDRVVAVSQSYRALAQAAGR